MNLKLLVWMTGFVFLGSIAGAQVPVPDVDVNFVKVSYNGDDIFEQSIILGPYQEYDIRTEIANLGNASATDFTINYHISEDLLFQRDDDEVEDDKNTNLAAGNTLIEHKRNLEAPDDPGIYYVFVRLSKCDGDNNPDNDYSSADNAEEYAVIEVRAPDLTVDQITLDGNSGNDSSFIPDQEIDLSFTATNNGGNLPEHVVLNYYQSEGHNNPDSHNGLIFIDSVEIARSKLHMGESHTLGRVYQVPKNAGDYTITAFIDSTNQAEESNENNNLRSIWFTVKKQTGISLSAPANEISVSQNLQIEAVAHYADGSQSAVPDLIQWVSSNESVAVVDQNGLVTGVSDGHAIIYATNGSFVNNFVLAVGGGTIPNYQSHGNLIIVAGGGIDDLNNLRETTQYLADLVYYRFTQRLFGDDDIFYFNPLSSPHDLDGDSFDDGIVDDDSPTVDEFGLAITDWAAQQHSVGPLYIYLIDHGGIGAFKIYPGEILEAQDFKNWLDSFEDATNRDIVVMIDACKSGSFTELLIETGDRRIVVTSTGNGDAYYQIGGAISFTQFFIDRLLAGDTINEGWSTARDILRGIGVPYSLMNPLLAEGIVSLSNQIVVGGNFWVGSDCPVITGNSPNEAVDAFVTPKTIFADVFSEKEIVEVFARLVPPNYTTPATVDDFQSPPSGPDFVMSDPDQDGRYEMIFDQFIYNGEYEFTFWARDIEDGVNTLSPATIFTVSGGRDPNFVIGDLDNNSGVELKDAIIALKIVAGLQPIEFRTDNSLEGISVNDNGKIGLEEVLFILQNIAGLR